MDYKKNYYDILGVEHNATREVLRDSYRRLAKLHHPDKNQDNPKAEERFKEINEAYEVLSNVVTRHIYDSYRAKNESQSQYANPGVHQKHSRTYKPFAKTKTRSYTVQREKRVYVYGTIEVKFQGDPEPINPYTNQREQWFRITTTEVMVTITSTDIYKNRPPKEYERSYSSAELFKTPLKQPVNCKVIIGEREEYYQLELYDIRVRDPKLKDITRHEEFSFGTLEGTLFAFVPELYEEIVTEQYTEYSGSTGKFETKNEGGYTFTRHEFYTADGSTSWSQWARTPIYNQEKRKTQTSSGRNYKDDNWSLFFWLLILLVLVVIYPKILMVILTILAFGLFLALAGWVISVFNTVLPWLSGLAICLLIFAALRSLFSAPDNRTVRTTSNRENDSVSTEKTYVKDKNDNIDTIIRHNLAWEDRDSARYAIALSVSTSALRKSSMAHSTMDYQWFGVQGIGSVYKTLLDTDSKHTESIALAFDSLAKSKSLDDKQKASMIVSCIQSIPYKLVVDGSCSGNYNDEYVRQFLASCEGDCCKGYAKFGVQSPVEFIADLKGDCDTRALIIYDILGKLNYRVALLTSNYYKHALIAVHLHGIQTADAAAIHIGGEPYYLWETTSKGFGPGELPATLSNLNHWNIALIQ